MSRPSLFGQLAIAARIARRELRGGLRGFRIFLTCLTLGVAAIAAVGSVRVAIQEGLLSNGGVLLGGDGEVRLTYRFANAAERAGLEAAGSELSEVVDFRSMAVTGQGQQSQRALTQVKGVDRFWPLLGTPAFDPPLGTAQVLAGRDGLPGAAMDPILADRLGIEPGDRFRLGTREFVLMARLLREPDGLGAGFAFGPRTLVASEALEGSGLLAPGTLYEVRYRLLARAGQSLADLEAAAMAGFADAGARWRNSTRAEPTIERFVERLGDFLVLVGLAGLAVGGIGISAAVRAYLDGKTEVIATLKTLGASGGLIFTVYFLQIGALTALGLGLGLVLGALLPIGLAPLLGSQLPVPFVPAIYSGPLAEAALYGGLTALIFTLWPLARVEGLRAAALYRGDEGRAQPRQLWLGVLTLAGLALVGSVMLLSEDWRIALGAACGLGSAMILLYLAATGLRALAARLARSRGLRGRSALRLALGAIGHPREGAVSVVLSLGLGLSVLASVGQIDANLRAAIASELPERAPSYFFIDIQPDQMPRLTAHLDGDPGVSGYESAAQLRGVVTAINGRAASELPPHWVLRGDRGVTYFDALPRGTRITEGEIWPEGYRGENQISMAQAEATELGIRLGDTITVNILGRDITGRVTSLREVDFRSGGLGFVIAFNAAALSGAPHSFVLTAYTTPEAEARILRDVAGDYPNITAIRVREVIEQATEALGALASAISAAALVTLATGFVVLIGAAAAGERGRVFESAVLKTLGASRRTILWSFALRSILMGAAAGLVAILAGGIAGWAVLTLVMDMSFSFRLWPALTVVGGGILATLGAGLIFALRPLGASPARVLRAQEG